VELPGIALNKQSGEAVGNLPIYRGIPSKIPPEISVFPNSDSAL
jgi:hypothetical protein